MARSQAKTIVRYGHGLKSVTFYDEGLARAVEAVQQENPPGEAGPQLDAPPGRYVVRSRSALAEGRTEFWGVVLDPERGVLVGPHNCPARAANPRANIQCRHIALAWLCWKADHDRRDPFLRRLHDMSDQPTALTVRPQAGMVAYAPSPAEVANNLALAKVLFETRGSAIPQDIKTVPEVAAVIMAGHALGLDPMTSFRRIYVVNGRTQPDAQCMAALIQKAGGDIIEHELTDDAADLELVYPGRQNKRVRYTRAMAEKAGLTGKAVWKAHPQDMLYWKAVTRLGRRGAADIVNAIEGGMVDLLDVTDQVALVQPINPDGEDGHGAVDVALDELVASGHLLETEGPWRAVNYAEAQANKKTHADALTAFGAAIRGHGGKVPEAAAEMTLGEVADALTGAA